MSGDWSAHQHGAHTYYYNRRTKVSTWTKPEGFQDAASVSASLAPDAATVQKHMQQQLQLQQQQQQQTYAYAVTGSSGGENNGGGGIGAHAKVKFGITKPIKPSTVPVIDPTKKRVNTVNARNTSNNGAPGSEATTTASKTTWPNSLRGYVQRAFHAAQRDSTTALMEDALKILIDKAIAGGTLHSTNWDTIAVPDVKKYAPNSASSMSPKVVVCKNKKNKKMQSANDTTPFLTATLKNKRKRLGNENAEDEDEEELRRRMERAGRFGDGHAVGGIQVTKVRSTKTLAHNVARQRHAHHHMSSGVDGASNHAPLFDSASAPAVKGKCKDIEKSYFRLTSAPPASSVRPLRILKQALARLNQMVETADNCVAGVPGGYLYLCDQLKAIRQDLTVQHLALTSVDFCVLVYECHARYAIEALDFAEFNQCQTKLFNLYATCKDSSSASATAAMQNWCEFLAYRILYTSCVLDRSGELERLRCLKEIVSMQHSSHGGGLSDARVSLAVGVSRSVASNNYVNFFVIHDRMRDARPPNEHMRTFLRLAALLMQDAVDRQRFRGLGVMCSAYRPTMPIAAAATHLGFRHRNYYEFLLALRSEDGATNGDKPDASAAAAEATNPFHEMDDEDEFECQDWLTAHGAVLTDPIESTGGSRRFKSIEPKRSANSIFVPDKEDAVAHGDASLHASDFFSKRFMTNA